MNKKAVTFLIGGVLVAGLAGSLLGGLFFGPGDEDAAECPPCWPNYLCPIPENSLASAYEVLQRIRLQAWDDFKGASPKITKQTFNRVAEALIRCASDIDKFAHQGNTGNKAHRDWLKTVWIKAKKANTDFQWAAPKSGSGPQSVATDLEAGH